jgi:ferredoxin
MDIKKINLIYFSPTYTTRKIAQAIARGTALKAQEYDITHLSTAPMAPSFKNDELVLIGLPVYFGRVPIVVLEYIKALRGVDTLCILLGVYGNRHYDDYFIELADILQARGFVPMAAAAFLGEHSFTSKVAGGRPNEDDIKTAEQFGKEIMLKSSKPNAALALTEKAIPGNRPYRPYTKNNAPLPEYAPIVNVQCNSCGICVAMCPTDAINPVNIQQIDPIKCIRCCACVRNCPLDAIEFTEKAFFQSKSFLETEFATIYKEPLLIL